MAEPLRWVKYENLPSGKHLHNYGISLYHPFQWEYPPHMTIFHGYVSLPEGTQIESGLLFFKRFEHYHCQKSW